MSILDYTSSNPISDKFPKRHNKTDKDLPDILNKTKHENNVLNFVQDTKKLLFAVRKNKYFDNIGQILENKKEELIDTEKKIYRDKIANAWTTTQTQKIVVNDGYTTDLYGNRIPITKNITINYVQNTITKEIKYA